MKFIHYSDKPITELIQFDYPPALEGMIAIGKPNGIWFSAEEAIEDDENWFTWCTKEEFNLDRLICPHEIKFKSSARILYLNTISEILDFNEMYGYQMFPIQDSFFSEEMQELLSKMRPNYCPLYKSMDSIRWEAVKAMWQAIVIAPYQWGLRLHSPAHWYYGWDCASGCVWDVSAIESFSHVPRKLLEHSQKQSLTASIGEDYTA